MERVVADPERPGDPTGLAPDGRTASAGAERRAAILDHAAELFARDGFRGTSLASIAQAAGLSQPGLLHHFPSKSALLVAVLARRDDEDGRLSSAHLDGSGLAILGALERLAEHNETTPDLVRLFSVLLGEGLASSHPAHQYMVERYERIRSRISRNLQVAETSGEIRPGLDLAAVTAVVVAVMDGLQFQWLLEPEVDLARSYRTFRELLERALVPDRARPVE